MKVLDDGGDEFSLSMRPSGSDKRRVYYDAITKSTSTAGEGFNPSRLSTHCCLLQARGLGMWD